MQILMFICLASQIDTKNILFICGGAFVDLEKTISERRHDSSIGFRAQVRSNMRSGGVINAEITSSLLKSVESGDLIAYGLIPEFVGRFPILVGLSSLSEDQLVEVLTEPKNALGRQYTKLFEMNDVRICLEFCCPLNVHVFILQLALLLRSNCILRRRLYGLLPKEQYRRILGLVV